jgi:hypothetical protein
MIELTITPRTNLDSKNTWWFVEWPKSGAVSPNREVRLLDIVYDEMKYVGSVGFCVQYTTNDTAKTDEYHVMFVDHYYYYSTKDSTYYQRKNYEHIVGMVFKDRKSAELFKDKIEALWTFKALQRDYS